MGNRTDYYWTSRLSALNINLSAAYSAGEQRTSLLKESLKVCPVYWNTTIIRPCSVLKYDIHNKPTLK